MQEEYELDKIKMASLDHDFMDSQTSTTVYSSLKHNLRPTTALSKLKQKPNESKFSGFTTKTNFKQRRNLVSTDNNAVSQTSIPAISSASVYKNTSRTWI